MLLTALLSSYLLAIIPINAQKQPTIPELGAIAFPFDLSQVSLSSSRWLENQNRTLNYLRAIDVDRLLYVFRSNHKLSTNGAQANGGWDAPSFPFRSHIQGHFLTSFAQCGSTLRDSTCQRNLKYMVEELAKCQANNNAAGFSSGYLSGFPESEFSALESGQLKGGNVPYYAIHKTMAGLLDAWTIVGNDQARQVLLAVAGWVDNRTKKLSASQMQSMLSTEFGGMNDVLANIYQLTGDKRWLAVAQRFDHTNVFDPLASNQDKLNGLHANTQIPKWIGALREYKATGTQRYLNIAKNAWDMTISAHTYAIGANSQAEHFRAPNAISGFLANDTAEHCNTYNMLKLTRDLWTTEPSNTKYFDYYERALFNHLLGAQNPSDNHGHITYFTPLTPGGHRGLGPAWGGGTWSTDYNSFWCCMGTGLETNTKLADSIYGYDDSAVYINLFTPSTLDWKQRSVKITQSTTFPVGDTTTLTVSGTGTWAMRLRIPAWTRGATLHINGQPASVTAKPGSYAQLSRTWTSGDTVTLQLPMRLQTLTANDNPSIAAVVYGPIILSGNYGNAAVPSMPKLALPSIRRTGNSSLAFTATADGKAVGLGPFYDAQGFNYNVYWSVSGSLPSG